MSKAIIIKGNPEYVRNNPVAEKFYRDIAEYVQAKGLEVEIDPGEPYTSPSQDAILWIGHSRGRDRLRFAPPRIKTIDLTLLEHQVAREAQSTEDDMVKSLGFEKLADIPSELRRAPPSEHYIFTDEMRASIDEFVTESQHKNPR